MSIFDKCDSIRTTLINHRRRLHTLAEVGFDLPKTSSYIFNELKALGYSPRKIAKGGVVADIGDPSKGFILLRADIDALPINEEADLDFASKSGNMHACGHDMHAAMLLGAAEIIAKEKERLGIGVRLLFQPAEELLEGALKCIDEGVLVGVKAAFMLHCLTALPLSCGTAIVSSPGISAPGAVYFDIELYGEAAHGATPSLGVDAIYAMTQVVSGIHQIRSHELSSTDTSVISLGRIEGGSVPNALADKVTASGTLRSFDKESIDYIKARINEISERIASAYRASASVKFPRSCPPLINDEGLSCRVWDMLREKLPGVIRSEDLAKDGAPAGSEDFAYIAEKVPSLMIGLCAGKYADGYEYPLHHPKCRFDENALVYGTVILSSIALDIEK